MKTPKRILTISDIHGCADKLTSVLTKAQYNPKEDQLILLGDYIDRGEQSYESVQLVKFLVSEGAIALMGNHEDMAIGAAKKEPLGLETWLRNGGQDTIESYARNNALIAEDMEFIESLPLYHETEDYIFVHAGLDPEEPLPETNDRRTLLWIRNEWLNCDYVGKPVIFGHTPMKRVTKWPNGKKIAIDTGAVFGGKLSCLELPTMRLFDEGAPC